jgi:UDP-3-O-[3-hydroxymyristoyl] glucosamine N-acyltransferase
VGHIEIGDRVIVGAKSGVSKNIPAGETWFGYPAAPMKDYKERLAYINRLEKLYARVRKLEQVLDAKGISSEEET